jgi:hypothetical protein
MPWQLFSLFIAIALAIPSVDAIASTEAANTQTRAQPLTQSLAQTPTTRPANRPRRRPVTITFNPPRRGAPPATVGLGSRGDCLENRSDSLSVLIPTGSSGGTSSASDILVTTELRPSFFVYVPAYNDSAQSLSLRLMQTALNGEEIELYQQTFALPSQAGIVELRPAPSVPALQVERQYHWYVSMVCDLMDQSGNPVVEGWIERVVPDTNLSSRLAEAAPLDQAVLYGEAGIWQDTLMILAELQRSQPTDLGLQETWRDLLRSVGLEAIANAPLLNCCQPLSPASDASTP